MTNRPTHSQRSAGRLARRRSVLAAACVATTLALAFAPASTLSATFAQDAPMPAADVDSKGPVDADLQVRSVTLFSSGVGYFEHRGVVDGEAQTQLRFKADQINDLLKSLVLQDLGGGVVEAVNYPSNQPLSRQLGSFQIDLSGDVSLTGILSQLQGAELNLAGAFGEVSGTVVSVDGRDVAEGETVVSKPYVTLFTGVGMKSIAVEQVETFEIADEKLRQEMAAALSALAKARDKDKKPVTFKFSGDGERDVRLAYVVETPVWKTSYRLILGGDNTNLQGWAIVENQTDNDWEDVSLSLVSGRPISFEMDLADPLFVQRPTVQIPRYQSLRPKAYDDGIAVAGVPELDARMMRQPAAVRRGGGGGSSGGGGGGGFGGGNTFPYAEAVDAAPMDMNQSIQSAASAADLGELFSYTVGSVTLPRQSSAMIPVVTDEIESEKVSVYDPGQLRDHPLNGVLLTNNTDKHLLAGPITVFEDGGYAGDSQIKDTPPGENRLLTYGIDLKVDAQVTQTGRNSDLMTGTLSRGVLILERKNRTERTYTFGNDTSEARTIVIEHPYDRNYKLVDTPEPMETTQSSRRFKHIAEAGTSKFVIKAEQVTSQQVRLLNLDADELIAYTRQGAIPQNVKDALAEAAKLRRSIVEAETRLRQLEQARTDIAQEQQRIRENMRTVDKSSGYYKRLLEKLDSQESELEKIAESEDQQRAEVQKRTKAYRDYVENLSV